MSELSPNKICDDYYVIGQIHADDLDTLKKMGFKTILNNRPEKEEYDQPAGEEIKIATEHAGLAYYYLPIIATIDKDVAQSFRKIFQEAPKPILAFCRTGTRCTHLWTESMPNDAHK